MKRPNILFILIDDMGWMDLSCQGSSFYETPNIDSIAREGMKFSRAYASCPVCSPTRASIMSGKYPARVGVTQWIGGSMKGKVISAPYLHYLPLSEKTLASTLKENNYHTYHVGKWHLGDEEYWPENHGFEVNIGGCHMGHPWSGYFSPYNNPRLKDGPDGEYLPDRLTDEAISLLKKNGDNPFYLNMAYYCVHTPIQVPDDEVEYFKEKAHKMGLDTQEVFERDEINFVLEHKNLQIIERRKIQSDPRYAGMIYRLDKNIGRLLQCLRDLEKEDDTIVIFYSDNGGLSDGRQPPTSNSPLRFGKSYIYEGGLREPLLIKWPQKIKPGSVSDFPITSPDFYPTLLECCKIPLIPEQHVDGSSFYTELIGEKPIISRQALFWHYPHYNSNGAHPASCVIDGRWKLIEWHEDNSYELYDLHDDLGEFYNLIDEKPDIAKKLMKILETWKKDVKAKMPTPNSQYHTYHAKIKIKLEGMLKTDAEGYLTISTRLNPQNPMLFDIPIIEILEDFIDRTILLKLNNIIRTGRLQCLDDKLVFDDIHEERIYPISQLCENLLEKKISISAFAKYPQNLLIDGKKPIPQVEILKLK